MDIDREKDRAQWGDSLLKSTVLVGNGKEVFLACKPSGSFSEPRVRVMWRTRFGGKKYRKYRYDGDFDSSTGQFLQMWRIDLDESGPLDAGEVAKWYVVNDQLINYLKIGQRVRLYIEAHEEEGVIQAVHPLRPTATITTEYRTEDIHSFHFSFPLD
ncbi:hypothetical protein Lepto7375DRAFT_0078 [Leptolyngbya sp. PCC 7375]|nr:hypothetical protein Lepto7375DRAFT_0078 [Leptolyngbya sp. PCC 7375]